MAFAANPFDIAEPFHRQRPRFLWCVTGADELLLAHRQMEVELIVEVLARIGAPEAAVALPQRFLAHGSLTRSGVAMRRGPWRSPRRSATSSPPRRAARAGRVE